MCGILAIMILFYLLVDGILFGVIKEKFDLCFGVIQKKGAKHFIQNNGSISFEEDVCCRNAESALRRHR